jgi:membrane protein DedA with SNARE-associated domain
VVEALISNVAGWDLVIYPLIAIALALEGDFVLFAVMLAVFQGVLHPAYAISAAAVGTLLGDAWWFNLGASLRNKQQNRIVRGIVRITDSFEHRLQRHPRRILFLSKLTYGLHRPIIIRTGMTGMSLKRFMRADIPAASFWFLSITGLAYVASVTLLPVRAYLHYVEFALLAAFTAFIAVQLLLGTAIGTFLRKGKR